MPYVVPLPDDSGMQGRSRAVNVSSSNPSIDKHLRVREVMMFIQIGRTCWHIGLGLGAYLSTRATRARVNPRNYSPVALTQRSPGPAKITVLIQAPPSLLHGLGS